MSVFDCFAIAAPGLEPIVAGELTALGIRAEPTAGGVTFRGSTASVAMANLWLRTASRVIVRVAEFKARSFFELERHARRIPWDQFVAEGAAVAFRVTCRKSRLYHSDAVAQRFAEAVTARFGDKVRVIGAAGQGEDDDGAEGTQLFIVRFSHDSCTVSADSSGALLHRRGYRLAIAKAPMRETLAAAMLLGAGWTGDTPLVDPMCGSGTIPIEGALIARRMAPGVNRDFAFRRWPSHHEGRWQELRAHAVEGARSRSPVPIAGSDRDAGAVEMARANAERAGVSGDITWTRAPISDAAPAGEGEGEGGIVVVNPPYGQRVGEADRVRDLYASMGHVLRDRFAGWRLVMLSAERRLESQTGIGLRELFATSNGGIPVRAVVGDVPNRG